MWLGCIKSTLYRWFNSPQHTATNDLLAASVCIHLQPVIIIYYLPSHFIIEVLLSIYIQILINIQWREQFIQIIMKYLTSCLKATNNVVIDDENSSESQIQSNAEKPESNPIVIHAKPHISKFCRITPIRRIPPPPPKKHTNHKIEEVQISDDSDSHKDSQINEEIRRQPIIPSNQGARTFKRRLMKVANKCKIEGKQYSSTECSICLGALENKQADEIGRLPCKHVFCFDCIYHSSKFYTKCPYCRTPYKYIDRNYQLIPVQEKDQEEDFDPYDQPCYVCGKNDDFDHLLQCEYCESAFCHTYCDTRLESDVPPEESWYCLSCSSLLGN